MSKVAINLVSARPRHYDKSTFAIADSVADTTGLSAPLAVATEEGI